MKRLTIGIQGSKGSTNEKACVFLATKYGWHDYDIRYLISTENVLRELNKGTIDYGTFAWESSRGGLVKETQEAIQHFSYKKIDEHAIQIDHALLSKGKVEKNRKVNIFSHPQALKEHASYLQKEFPHVELIEEVDTALAAEKLQNNQYPDNSLVIAPISCAKMYSLDIYLAELPTNQGYFTTIWLVQK